jgi:L-threonylcarbamoyladenylate synthase
MNADWQEAVKILKNGGVGVLPTDTIYGLVGSAFSKGAVESVYKVRGRDEGKPCIILVSSYKELEKFDIQIEPFSFWPGKVSVVVPLSSKESLRKFKYLHRGADTLAFRMVSPRNKNLFTLIKRVGPLVAPSANPQGLAPAENITQAKRYFGDTVDFYVSSGTKKSKPSTLVAYKDGKITLIRQGAVAIRSLLFLK